METKWSVPVQTYSHHHFSPDSKFSINHLQQYHSQYMAKCLHNITRSVSKAAHQIHCQTDKVETIPSEHWKEKFKKTLQHANLQKFHESRSTKMEDLELEDYLQRLF